VSVRVTGIVFRMCEGNNKRMRDIRTGKRRPNGVEKVMREEAGFEKSGWLV
jgi:hypothetical protein